MFKSIFIASLLVSSLTLSAQDFDPSLEIANVEVIKLEVKPTSTTIQLPKVPTNPVEEVAMYVDGIIAIGKKVWNVIQAGMPVITTSGFSNVISVLPAINNQATHPALSQMANWSAPKSASYQVVYKNYFDQVIASFVYTIIFQYNGSYKGNGKYITGLQVQPSDIYAMYLTDLDVKTELMNVANVGTDENPVASAMIRVSYKVKGRVGSQGFYVDGLGDLKTFK